MRRLLLQNLIVRPGGKEGEQPGGIGDGKQSTQDAWYDRGEVVYPFHDHPVRSHSRDKTRYIGLSHENKKTTWNLYSYIWEYFSSTVVNDETKKRR